MENEKSLVEAKMGIFSRIRQAVFNFFRKFKKDKISDTIDQKICEDINEENIEITEEKTKDVETINDFDILKDVVNGKIQINDLDIETEKRLIELCDNRLRQIKEKIREKDLEIANLERNLNELKMHS